MARSNGSGAKKAYLVFYNAVSAIAWATILGRVGVVLGWKGAPFVPLVVDNFARITQTCAAMEILHALTGETTTTTTAATAATASACVLPDSAR